jgi:preprotein translocase SecE subunit
MNKLVQYLVESKQELSHVKWPTRKQLVELTLIVLGISLAMAFFTGVLDFLFQWLYTLLLKLGGK